MIEWNVFTPWMWCVPLHPKPLKASRWGKGRDLTKHLYRYANDRSSDKLRWKIEAKKSRLTDKAGARRPPPSSNTAKGRADATVTSSLLLLVWYWMSCFYCGFQYLAKKLGFDTLWFGYLQTMVGFCQLFGGPLFGRWGGAFHFRPANRNK